MIKGNFGSDGELFFDIELIAAQGELPAITILDTGFLNVLPVQYQVYIVEELMN